MRRFKGRLRMRGCREPTLPQCRFPIPPAVEQAQHRHGLIVDYKSDRYPALEANNSEARSDIPSQGSAFGREVESEAVRFQPLDVCHRGVRSGRVGNPFIETNEIVDGLRRKDNVATPQERAFCRFAWRPRTSANALSALTARAGLAFIAS